MSEIKCPHCEKQFTVSESDYESIISQIRTSEFEKELTNRLIEAKKANKAETRAKIMETEKIYEKKLSDSNNIVADLTRKLESEKTNGDAKLEEKEYEFQTLRSSIETQIKEKELEFKSKLKEEEDKAKEKSWSLRSNVCKKCGKPLTMFEGWTCIERDKAMHLEMLKAYEEELRKHVPEEEFTAFATKVAKTSFLAEVMASPNEDFRDTVFEHWDDITRD